MLSLNYIFLGIFLLFPCLIRPGHGQRVPYQVTSILMEPFLMQKNDSPLTGNDRYEGFCKDLADLIAQRLNITYELHVANSYGQMLASGVWDGMIGEVREGVKARIGIAPITINHDRMKAVDFSTPFMEFRLGILMKNPKQIEAENKHDGDNENDDDHGQYIFLRPMTWVLWLVFILAIGVTVAVLFIVERLIAQRIYEAKLRATIANDLPPLPPPVPIGLCSNGVIGSPRSGTGRFLQIVFWIFVILFIAAYIATFAADRVVDRLDEDDDDPVSLKYKSIEDLLGQDQVKLSVLRGGSSYEYLKKTQDRTYRKIFNLIPQENLANSSETGLELVRRGRGEGENATAIAFIMEGPTASHHANSKPCDFLLASEQFGPKKGYSIITQQGLDITRQINLAILAMKEGDELDELEHKWFSNEECGVKKNGNGEKIKVDTDEEDHDPLCLSDMAGIFYILLLAIIIALVVALLELRHYSETPRTTIGNDRAVEVPMRET